MKQEIRRNILNFQEKLFFKPIREVIDFITIVINASEQILSDDPDPKKKCSSEMKLIVNKMSRIFFYKQNKYFSISFPLKVNQDYNDNKYRIETKSGQELSLEIISAIRSILNDKDSNCIISIIGSLPYNNDYSHEVYDSAVKIIKEIMLQEPSYIRYDRDKENEKGELHPLNHIDVNYSQNGTYKIGLNKDLKKEEFESLLNTKERCYYINIQ